MKTRSILLGMMGIGVLASLLFVAMRQEPVPVDLAAVARDRLEVTVDVEGKTRVAEIFEVAAPIRGVAQRSPVRVGDRVVAGETIVAVVEPAASDPLDPRRRIQAEAAVREAEAGLYLARSTLRQSEAELELAQSQHRRTAELVRKGVSSFTALENAENVLGVRKAALQAAISRLEQAKGTLDRARAELIEPTDPVRNMDDCCLNITAPVDGLVLEIDMISERPVIAGTRLLSVGATDKLEIVADVFSADAVRLAPGNRAKVTRWGGPLPLAAQITSIEPSGYTKVSALGIEEQRVDVILDIKTPFDERASLSHGFSVFLEIVEWEGDDVLLVPVSALFRQGNDWAVFAAQDDTAQLRIVRIGRMGQNFAEVLEGVEDGQRVILHPTDRLRDGVAIVERITE